MKLPFLSEVIAESMWSAMGWVCHQSPNVVINTFEACVQVEKHEMVAHHKSD